MSRDRASYVVAQCTSTRRNPQFKGRKRVPYAWCVIVPQKAFARFKRAIERRWPDVTVTMRERGPTS
jgi:hypothetical protein